MATADTGVHTPSVAPGRVRKAWRVSVKGYDGSDIVFAPTAGRARMHVWRSLDGWKRVVDISVRRATDRDVILPAPDPIAAEMAKKERHCLLHAFGANTADPTKAGYREYFYTSRDDPPLVSLTERGLMKPMEGDKWGKGMTYFVLTERGKHVALSLVPEYRA